MVVLSARSMTFSWIFLPSLKITWLGITSMPQSTGCPITVFATERTLTNTLPLAFPRRSFSLSTSSRVSHTTSAFELLSRPIRFMAAVLAPSSIQLICFMFSSSGSPPCSTPANTISPLRYIICPPRITARPCCRSFVSCFRPSISSFSLSRASVRDCTSLRAVTSAPWVS